MAVVVIDSFDYRGKKPDFARQLFTSIEAMASFSENYLPDMYLAFNTEDMKAYMYKRSNTVDDTLGKWREFTGEGGSADLTNYYNKAEIQTLLELYVAKEVDRDLSTNDYTNEEKTKVQNATDAITILNGAVTVEGSVQKQISDAIAGMDTKINMLVDELPDIDDARDDVIYLVQDETQLPDTVYNMYMVIEDDLGDRTYLPSGSTSIDLSGYALEEDLIDGLAEKLSIANGAINADKAVVTDDEGNIIFVDKSVFGSTAETVEYDNDAFPALTNVDLALDAILAKIYYVDPSITSFTCSPATTEYEIGSSIPANTLSFAWAVNKDIVSQTLTDCTVDVSDRTATYDLALSTTKTFTLTVGDGEKTASATKRISFLNKVYWGSAAEPANYTSAFILSLSGNKLISSVNGNYSFNVANNEYGYFAMPQSMKKSSAWVNGFNVDLEDCGNISFTNASGHTSVYSIVRFTQKSLGAFTAELK